MAKLPYVFTICPDQETPKSYTAMTPWMINAMRHGGDLTIDQRAFIYPSVSSDFEGSLRKLLQKNTGK